MGAGLLEPAQERVRRRCSAAKERRVGRVPGFDQAVLRGILNFRVGKTEDNSIKPPANYGCGPGGNDTECADFELGGELEMPGSVFYIGTSNVN